MDQQSQLEAMARALPPQAIQAPAPQPQAGANPQAQQPQQPSFMDLLVRHLVSMLSLPQPQQQQPLPQRMQAGPALQQYGQDMNAVMQELQRQNGGR